MIWELTSAIRLILYIPGLQDSESKTSVVFVLFVADDTVLPRESNILYEYDPMISSGTTISNAFEKGFGKERREFNSLSSSRISKTDDGLYISSHPKVKT